MAKIGINLATGSLQKEEMIVGIDLGTTNSLIAIIHPETKQPVALKEHNSSSLVPSIVHFDAYFCHFIFLKNKFTNKHCQYYHTQKKNDNIIIFILSDNCLCPGDYILKTLML